MLFNSYIFIFVYLPVVLVTYSLLNRLRLTVGAKTWLVFASLFFYGWWDMRYLNLIASSILFNYAASGILREARGAYHRPAIGKAILLFSVAANIALLGYFKYRDFFIGSIYAAFGQHLPMVHIILPLGISFYTITQIAYLVDTYRGLVRERNFINYALFVTFFPHLLAGPIIHHSEMMPQFASLRTKAVNCRNLSIGLFLFAVGLFKKTVIADTFSVYATTGFDAAQTLGFIEAWATSLSYTCQIYFDFSGYTDMALGAALMFNIRLPMNFDSPYQALNIQDFWRRWHITLTRFLRDYVYIPLGGNRSGETSTVRNLMLTFLIGGLWHGAAWTFVFWGFLHGAAIVAHRLWRKTGRIMHRLPAWFLTFLFVNITWVFFRAKGWHEAIKVLKGMFGLNGEQPGPSFPSGMNLFGKYGIYFDRYEKLPDLTVFLAMSAFAATIVFFLKNSMWHQRHFQFSGYYQAATVSLFVVAILQILHLNRVSEFLYFQF